MIGIFACIACNVINYFVNKEDFIDLKGLGACCIDGAKQAASIAIPTAACGIIINVVTGQTSLATNLSNLISALGTSNLFLALLIAMVGCMILGMALPTVAAYLVGVILFVPCIPGHSAGWRHGRLYLQPLREHVRVLLWHHGPDHAARCAWRRIQRRVSRTPTP